MFLFFDKFFAYLCGNIQDDLIVFLFMCILFVLYHFFKNSGTFLKNNKNHIFMKVIAFFLISLFPLLAFGQNNIPKNLSNIDTQCVHVFVHDTIYQKVANNGCLVNHPIGYRCVILVAFPNTKCTKCNVNGIDKRRKRGVILPDESKGWIFKEIED